MSSGSARAATGVRMTLTKVLLRRCVGAVPGVCFRPLQILGILDILRLAASFSVRSRNSMTFSDISDARPAPLAQLARPDGLETLTFP